MRQVISNMMRGIIFGNNVWFANRYFPRGIDIDKYQKERKEREELNYTLQTIAQSLISYFSPSKGTQGGSEGGHDTFPHGMEIQRDLQLYNAIPKCYVLKG